MAASHYPNGFTNGVTIRGVPLQQTNPGAVFFVNGSSALAVGGTAGSNGNPGTYQKPFATIDYAIGRCTANRGDLIMVLPGHTETISTATALNLDVAGITILGLGCGSNAPVITLDTATTTTIPVSAANITISNITFSANFAAIVSCFTLTAAKNFGLDKCNFVQTASAKNFLNIVDTNTTSNDADGLYVDGCSWVDAETTTLQFIKMDGTNKGVTFTNNKLVLGVKNNTPSIMAIATTKIVTAASVVDNYIYRLNTDTATGGILITTDVSTNSGFICHNHIQTADTAGEVLVTASSGFYFADNRQSGVAGASGYLLPTADS